jgi:hypothetical protein
MPKVSTLPTASTPLSGAETVYLVQGGNSRKATVADIWSAIPPASTIRLQTAIAAAGQTNIDFSGVPAWVNRVNVMLNGLSTTGTSDFLVQIGDSGGIEATGYVSTFTNTAAGVTTISHTTGFGVQQPAAAADGASGTIVLSRVSGNLWVAAGVVRRGTVGAAFCGGDKTLSDVLTQVRITTVGGVQTFDAGSVTISWE